MDFLSTLNNEQLVAVKETEGPVLVIAGAGSGKTRVLTSRIAYLIMEKGVKPSNILAITFTNKAANEMKERVINLVGESANSMWISTIHSMCLRILRNSVGRLDGYDKNFSVYSEVDKERVLKRIITELNLDSDSLLKDAKNEISIAKNNDISPERFEIESFAGANANSIAKIYKLYEETLKKSNAMDFDDLLVKTLHLFEEDAEVLDYYANKFEYIHIDEFQDTNHIQYRIAKLLASVHNNIFVVGDDDQSIYGWRGAEIKNILGFSKDFKGAKVYKLEQNYRSSKKILDLANTIIANNSVRSKKVLWTENNDGVKIETYIANDEVNEASYVAAQIKNLVARGAKYSDFAVLMRLNALSRSFEQEFLKYAIPYKVFGGFKFFERKEIKDLTAYLKLLINPLDDEAVLRVINTPKRGIGEKTIVELMDYAKRTGLSIFDAVCDVDLLNLSAGAKSKLDSFRRLISYLMMQRDSLSLIELVEKVIYETGFMSQFETNSEENISRRLNIDEYKNSVVEFMSLNKDATLVEFLSSITLSSDIDEADASNYVAIATIHSVKGLEFDKVFIIGLDETIFPISRAVGSPAEMEEERRLMYVAITRAKSRLYVTRARSRFIYGERSFTSQSRFITELSDKLGLTKPKLVATDDGYFYEEPKKAESVTGNFARTFSRSVPKTNASGKDFSKFKCGKRVKHARFGIGVIVSVKGGDKPICDVAFKGVGVKSFSLLLAPMEVID